MTSNRMIRSRSYSEDLARGRNSLGRNHHTTAAATASSMTGRARGDNSLTAGGNHHPSHPSQRRSRALTSRTGSSRTPLSQSRQLQSSRSASRPLSTKSSSDASLGLVRSASFSGNGKKSGASAATTSSAAQKPSAVKSTASPLTSVSSTAATAAMTGAAAAQKRRWLPPTDVSLKSVGAVPRSPSRRFSDATISPQRRTSPPQRPRRLSYPDNDIIAQPTRHSSRGPAPPPGRMSLPASPALSSTAGSDTLAAILSGAPQLPRSAHPTPGRDLHSSRHATITDRWSRSLSTTPRAGSGVPPPITPPITFVHEGYEYQLLDIVPQEPPRSVRRTRASPSLHRQPQHQQPIPPNSSNRAVSLKAGAADDSVIMMPPRRSRPGHTRG